MKTTKCDVCNEECDGNEEYNRVNTFWTIDDVCNSCWARLQKASKIEIKKIRMEIEE